MNGSTAHNGSRPHTDGEPAPLQAPFAAPHLTDLRHRVSHYCAHAGLTGRTLDDFVLAVYELLTNAVRHGGGAGHLELWRDRDALVCEVRDTGTGFANPANAPQPSVATPGGLGIWLADQLTDSMHVNSGPTGTTVRISTLLPPHRPTRIT